jgi:plasmid stability protein
MSLIQIRNVPEELHRRAKARAAMEGLTLSDLALRALEREIRRPTTAEIAARIRELGPVDDAPEAASLVRAERDAR